MVYSLFNVIIYVSDHIATVADKALLTFVVMTIKSPSPVKEEFEDSSNLALFLF